MGTSCAYWLSMHFLCPCYHLQILVCNQHSVHIVSQNTQCFVYFQVNTNEIVLSIITRGWPNQLSQLMPKNWNGKLGNSDTWAQVYKLCHKAYFCYYNFFDNRVTSLQFSEDVWFKGWHAQGYIKHINVIIFFSRKTSEAWKLDFS